LKEGVHRDGGGTPRHFPSPPDWNARSAIVGFARPWDHLTQVESPSVLALARGLTPKLQVLTTQVAGTNNQTFQSVLVLPGSFSFRRLSVSAAVMRVGQVVSCVTHTSSGEKNAKHCSILIHQSEDRIGSVWLFLHIAAPRSICWTRHTRGASIKE